MATLASPLFDRYFGRPTLPAGSVPDDTPVDPQRVGIIWYIPRPEMPAVPPAASFAARQERPAAWERAAAPTPTPRASSAWAAVSLPDSFSLGRVGWGRQTPPQAGTPGGATQHGPAGAASPMAGNTLSGSARAAVPPTIPPPSRRTSLGAQPPEPPRPQAGQRPGQSPAPRRSRPLSPRLRRCLEWVVSEVPERWRAEVFSAFVKTLRFRADLEERSSLEGAQPIGRERFGLLGEDLVPEGTVRVRVWLDDEVREIVRTLEMRLSRTRRNHYLAMHSARLGQLWRELEQRFEIDVLEEVKGALGRCWV
jgi:hypothetical protein